MASAPITPSEPSPDGACHFFRLPAELRNLVYEYVLLDPADLVCRKDPFGPFRFYPSAAADKDAPDKLGDTSSEAASVAVQPLNGPVVPLEINQLKYVCRQLNNESKNIIICNAELRFEDGVYYFAKLLKVLPVVLRNCLRKVIIPETRSSCHDLKFRSDKSWQIIENFCRTHTAVTVRMLYGWLTSRGVLHHGLLVATLLRKDRFFVTKMCSLPKFERSLGRYVMEQVPGATSLETIIENAPDFPTNIEIFPLETSWNETKYRGYWTPKFHCARHQEPDILERWIALVKDMHRNGI